MGPQWNEVLWNESDAYHCLFNDFVEDIAALPLTAVHELICQKWIGQNDCTSLDLPLYFIILMK